MSSEAQEVTSPEDKFFGVRNTISKGDGTAADGDSINNDLDIEVVDDRPPEDQRPPAKAGATDDDDAELASYSEGVQKRIKKMTWQQNELRREKEAAERMKEEAIRVAKQLSDENRQLGQTLATGEPQLVHMTKRAAEYAVNDARGRMAKAHETGATDELIAAQEALTVAQSEYGRALDYEANWQARSSNRQAQHQQPQHLGHIRPEQPQRPPPPNKPTEKAAMWAQENTWFGDENHKDMTALAYGVHEQLVRSEGISPDSDEYFERINSTMRQRFPDYFEGAPSEQGRGRQPTSPSPRPTQVVAPNARSNGANPRKVKLTSTQVSLAKRLGLTPEQYAKQLAKEMS